LSRPSDRPGIRIVQRVSLAIAIAGLIWAALLLVTGGFDGRIASLQITAHEPLRPLLFAAIALSVFILAGGDVSLFSRVAADSPRTVRSVVSRLWRYAPSADVTAWLLTAALFTVALVWGTKAIGGSDSWGYMSEAQGFLNGRVQITQPFVKDVPWPSRWWTFTPLGFKPISVYHDVTEADEGTIVPFYSPGLPLLMAAAHLIGGYQAMFFVVPLLSAAIVIGTYRIGLHLTSRPAALLGAWLTAISPCIMFMMMATMTDVPVAGAFAVGFWLLLDGGAWKAIGAGLATAVAIAIRPNFAPIAAIMALYYVPALFAARTRRTSILEGALFCVGVLPGPLTVAAVNAQLYGSPMMSGYGPLSQFFALDHIWPNLQRYPAWLAEAQTPVAWIGLAAVFLPTRWIWSGVRRTAALVISALTVLFVWGLYLVYDVYDAWWFSRFILTSWPFIMLGTAAVVVAIARIERRVLLPLMALVMILVSIYQVWFAVHMNTFNLWTGERRFVVAAKMARRLTPRNSVIISGQHTGSLRFYAGRMTMHYDPIQPEWVDRTVTWLNEHGAHPYLLVEDWEVPIVKRIFEGQRTLAMLEHPIATYQAPGELYLYDLAPSTSDPVKTEMVTGTYRDFWAARPAPTPPKLVFRP
jgi:hypothetical protein